MESQEAAAVMAVSASVSKVLDDDNLLAEIIVRLTFPTSLVRAALVCKRWLQHASDPAFLSRFCKLHPPRLLGFYVDYWRRKTVPCFIPMLPQPPELAAVICRGCFGLDAYQSEYTNIMDCWNGSVFIARYDRAGSTLGVQRPLCAERGMATIPPFPEPLHQDGYFFIFNGLLSKEEGGDLSYFYLLIISERTKYTVHVSMLQHGVWRTHRTLAIDKYHLKYKPKAVLVDNKIYIASHPGEIIVLDLKDSSFSTIQLPEGLEYGIRDTMLSRGHDASGLYLIQAKELQLRIWLHMGDNWLLLDTICLREMCANLSMSDCTVEDEYTARLEIKQVGENAEFVFLMMGQCVLYLDIKCRTLRKLYEMTKTEQYMLQSIYPFKMIWPPAFPALKDCPARNDRHMKKKGAVEEEQRATCISSSSCQ